MELEQKAGLFSLKAVHSLASAAEAAVQIRNFKAEGVAAILKNAPAQAQTASVDGSNPPAARSHRDFAPTEPQNLPFYARWFDLAAINQIEKQALGEFFQEKPSKTPEVYQRMRNFIVRLYWRNPKAYLTVSACRRALRGDVCAVFRVHAFLEHWSIINFCYKPAAVGWTALAASKRWFPSFAREDRAGERNTGSYISSFAAAPAPPPATGEAEADFGCCRLDSILCPTVLINRLFALDDAKRPSCTRCQKPVEATWYVRNPELEVRDSNPRPSFLACNSCFELDNFPIFYSKGDFRFASVFGLAAVSDAKEWSLGDHAIFLQIVQSSREVGEALTALRESFPQRGEAAITAQLLKSIQDVDRFEDRAQPEIRHTQLTFQTSLEGKFSQKLEEISSLFDSLAPPGCALGGGATPHLPSEKERKARTAMIEDLAAKVELKLRFFEEFEQILQRERHNLRALP